MNKKKFGIRKLAVGTASVVIGLAGINSGSLVSANDSITSSEKRSTLEDLAEGYKELEKELEKESKGLDAWKGDINKEYINLEVVYIPYEVIIKEDSELEIGKEKILVFGKVGKKEIKKVFKEINGVKSEPEITETILEEKIDEVIVRGTKRVESTTVEDNVNELESIDTIRQVALQKLEKIKIMDTESLRKQVNTLDREDLYKLIEKINSIVSIQSLNSLSKIEKNNLINIVLDGKKEDINVIKQLAKEELQKIKNVNILNLSKQLDNINKQNLYRTTEKIGAISAIQSFNNLSTQQKNKLIDTILNDESIWTIGVVEDGWLENELLTYKNLSYEDKYKLKNEISTLIKNMHLDAGRGLGLPGFLEDVAEIYDPMYVLYKDSYIKMMESIVDFDYRGIKIRDILNKAKQDNYLLEKLPSYTNAIFSNLSSNLTYEEFRTTYGYDLIKENYFGGKELTDNEILDTINWLYKFKGAHVLPPKGSKVGDMNPYEETNKPKEDEVKPVEKEEKRVPEYTHLIFSKLPANLTYEEFRTTYGYDLIKENYFGGKELTDNEILDTINWLYELGKQGAQVLPSKGSKVGDMNPFEGTNKLEEADNTSEISQTNNDKSSEKSINQMDENKKNTDKVLPNTGQINSNLAILGIGMIAISYLVIRRKYNK